MADAIADGVWWLHGSRGCNIYLVRADDGRYALIDGGFASCAPAVIADIRDVLGPEGRVDVVLLTHGHFDHVGASRAFAEVFGAEVIAGQGDCRDSEDGRLVVNDAVSRGRRRPPAVVRRFFELPDFLHETPVDRAIDSEHEVLPGLLALPLPGHTPGSFCFIAQRAGVAFVGDLVIGHSDGLARAIAGSNASDRKYLANLRAFAERTPDIGCPGHGYPVIGGFREQLLALSKTPREPLNVHNFRRRARRGIAFARFLLRTRTKPLAT